MTNRPDHEVPKCSATNAAETFHTERRGRSRRDVTIAVHEDAVRYFDGAAFELASLTVERYTVTYSGSTEYAAAATYRPSEGA